MTGGNAEYRLNNSVIPLRFIPAFVFNVVFCKKLKIELGKLKLHDDGLWFAVSRCLIPTAN